MGNAPSTTSASPGSPGDDGPRPRYDNNYEAVRALLLSRAPPDHPFLPSSSSYPSPFASSVAAVSAPAKPPPQCPMHNSPSFAAPPTPTPPKRMEGAPAKCPIAHDAPPPHRSSDAELNPLNQMPMLSQAPSASQTIALPTERTTSSIPRSKSPSSATSAGADAGAEAGADEEGDKWEYPSPQQFYNALVRKGWETPEEHVEMMVHIHNFLNEEAWQEVLKWEKRHPGGEKAELSRFQGKPGTMSPKARFFQLAGMVFPSKFSSEPPFDRHDWIIRRPLADDEAPTSSPSTASPPPFSQPTSPSQNTNKGAEVRYVIDYYSAPDDENGNPVFHLDVRPALDSFGALRDRVEVALEEWKQSRDEARRATAGSS